jgi:site-specific DNA-methyltransferase (adenine-specific)
MNIKESVGDYTKILCGDAVQMLRNLPARSVHTCVTSPPYWMLRDYGVTGQIGLEATVKEAT